MINGSISKRVDGHGLYVGARVFKHGSRPQERRNPSVSLHPEAGCHEASQQKKVMIIEAVFGVLAEPGSCSAAPVA